MAQVDESRHVVRPQLQRLLDRAHRVGEAILVEERLREVAPGVRVLGLHVDGLLEIRRRIGEVQLGARLAGEAKEVDVLRLVGEPLQREVARGLELASIEERERVVVAIVCCRRTHGHSSFTKQYLPPWKSNGFASES